MFSTSISLSLFMFYCHMTLINARSGHITCFRQLRGDNPITSNADCQAAIDKIPIFSDIPFHGGRQPKYVIPAVFRSGSCMITVDELSTVLPDAPKAPPAIYLQVWPEAKRTAARILAKCLTTVHGSNAGQTIIESQLDGKDYRYFIDMSGAPP